MGIDTSKPRVAIFYDVLPSTGYRDDGPPLFLNYNLRKILNGNGILEDHSRNVVHLSPLMPYRDFGAFDLHILSDYGEDALGIDLKWSIPHPNAYWISDAHLGYEYRMKRAKEFDHVFVAQRAFIEPLVEDGVPREAIHYLPHAFEPDIYRPISIVEKWDWCFIGYPNSAHRIDLLDRFIKEFPNYYLGWRMAGVAGYNELENCNEGYNQARLIINDSVKNDLNMRTLEALGAGRCLLTQEIPELDGIFENQKHLWTYRSLDEAVSIAKALLVDHSLRDSVAKAGHEEALSKHTYHHRVLEILKTCLNYTPKGELVVT